ncbi:CDP-diacylglycerol diphosphatase [Mycobacterium vicinigordonae]|uniref:CDP-diacylglycerol diphosphatase n=1 Tax=Mycobacterium vicinigordonae TaxID=1719132 RepID=A0A7D6HR43_9MYCO|nr:CDP-diacylglycerol diphosphatase [Mycobacterium vicinigordonae]QLL08011.1 CDP-diacylglycerol diphosphatase [Mycobacterium vicinigordonae]
MDTTGSADRRVTRRQFITTSGALGVGAAFVGSAAWRAVGDPGSTTPDCGGPNDGGELYESVKDAQPGDKHLALVDFPTPNKDRAYGYAIKTGAKGAWDWLCIPLIRVSGIECEKCWKGQMLNLWPYAAAWVNDPQSKLAGTDWALGINSGDPQARTQNQMHIHVTKLQKSVRDQITAAEKNKVPVAESFGDWPKKTIELNGRLFRWVHVKTMDHHIFVEAFNTVAQGKASEMKHQCIAVTSAGSGGFYVINSQAQLDTQGHHPFGIKTIDGLLYRG